MVELVRAGRGATELAREFGCNATVRTLCEVLRVSHGGFYEWVDRPVSARAKANAVLLERIEQTHRASDATYGMPRIHAELADQGVAAGRKRIARLMRAHGLRGVSRRHVAARKRRANGNGPAGHRAERDSTNPRRHRAVANDPPGAHREVSCACRPAFPGRPV